MSKIETIGLVDSKGNSLKPKVSEEVQAMTQVRDSFDIFQTVIESCKLSDIKDLEKTSIYAIIEELGEFAWWKKRIERGDYKTDEEQANALLNAVKELGHLVITLSMWCSSQEVPFGDVAVIALSDMLKRHGEASEKKMEETPIKM